MNYSQVLSICQILLNQNHLAQAVQTAAGVLETLLVELYNELLGQSPPARQRQLVEAQEKVGGGQQLSKLTLGSLLASTAPAEPTKTCAPPWAWISPSSTSTP